MMPLANHHLWWGRSEVTIYPDSWVDVGNQQINHPFGNGLWHLFMLIWRMVYCCFTHIIELLDEFYMSFPTSFKLIAKWDDGPRRSCHPPSIYGMMGHGSLGKSRLLRLRSFFEDQPIPFSFLVLNCGPCRIYPYFIYMCWPLTLKGIPDNRIPIECLRCLWMTYGPIMFNAVFNCRISSQHEYCTMVAFNQS